MVHVSDASFVLIFELNYLTAIIFLDKVPTDQT